MLTWNEIILKELMVNIFKLKIMMMMMMMMMMMEVEIEVTTESTGIAKYFV